MASICLGKMNSEESILGIFYQVLDKFILVLIIFIFIKVVLSWLPIDRNNRLYEFINTVTEPILSPLRKLIDKSIFGGKGQIFDLSPFIAVIILQVIQGYLHK